MSGTLKPLIFELQISSDTNILSKQRISLQPETRTNIEFKVATTDFDECVKNIHLRNLTIELVSNYDDELAINNAGFFLTRGLATAAILSLDVLFDQCPICTYYGEYMELERMLTKEYKEKLSLSYVYSERDIYKYHIGEDSQKRYVELDGHVQKKFKGKWISVPKERSKRAHLHQNYLNESRNTDFDIEEFWDNYVWSQVKLEMQKKLDSSSVDSITIPNFVEYETLAGADLRKHNRPDDGKISRQIIFKKYRCFLCYSHENCKFIMQEPDYSFSIPFDDSTQKTPIVYDIKFRITFLALSELVWHK